LSEEPVMVAISPAFEVTAAKLDRAVTFRAVSFKVSAASVAVRPDKYWQSFSVYINRVKRERRERRQELLGQYYIIILCVTFFFLHSSKK